MPVAQGGCCQELFDALLGRWIKDFAKVWFEFVVRVISSFAGKEFLNLLEGLLIELRNSMPIFGVDCTTLLILKLASHTLNQAVGDIFMNWGSWTETSWATSSLVDFCSIACMIFLR